MAKRIQDGKLLYHVTAVENLENFFSTIFFQEKMHYLKIC